MASIFEKIVDRYNHNYIITEEDYQYLVDEFPEQTNLIELVRLYVFENLTVSNPQPNYFNKNKKILYWRRQGDIEWETRISHPSQLLFDIGTAGRIVSSLNSVLVRIRSRVLQALRIIEALVNTGYVYRDEDWYAPV